MLINKELLKKYSLIPINYNMTEVMNYVDLAELLWVKPLLGSDFYDELVEQVKDNQLSEANSTLLVEALYPYLSLAVIVEYLPSSYLHISEVGITKGHSENSDSANLDDITYLTSHLRAELEERKRFTIKWLAERLESFPLWQPEEDFCGCRVIRKGCCEARLYYPQPLRMLYTTRKKCVGLF